MAIKTAREFYHRCRRDGGKHLFRNRKATRALSGVHFTLNERAAYRARFDAVAREGKVGVIVSGMDCDCTQYRYERVIDVPVSMVSYLKAVEDDAAYLDGPQSTYYVDPAEVEDGYHASADRALEAYENGHAHVAYWGDL